MKPNKQPWQNWVSIDLLLFVLIILCLIGLSIMAAIIPFKIHVN